MIVATYIQTSFSHGISEALRMITGGDPAVIDVTVRTLRLAFEAVLLASLVAVPLGCLAGVGAFRGRGVLLSMINAMTRTPPVVVGVLGVLLIYWQSPWGGGPLSGTRWYFTSSAAYFVQTMVAFPIITALTAAAVQTVPVELMDQARGFGASRWRSAIFALREARLAVIAGMLVALGVAITAVGAIIVVGADGLLPNGEPLTLAVGALLALHYGDWSEGYLIVAYATVLFIIFIVLAVLITWLQYGHRKRAWSAQPA